MLRPRFLPHPRKCVALAIIMVMGMLKLSPLATAQPLPNHRLVARIADWQLICKPAPKGSKQRTCGLVQNVLAEERTSVGLVIQYQQYAKSQRTIRIFAPVGVMLQQGLSLKIDGKAVCYAPAKKKRPKSCLPFPFLRCTAQACIAQIAVNPALMKQMKRGKTAIFVIYLTQEAGIGIPISLKGFAKALARLEAK